MKIPLPVKLTALAFTTICLVMLIIYSLAQANRALADDTPPPVISTGGNTSADPTNQGSSCSTRTPPLFAPGTRTIGYLWAEPDWPGMFQVARPTAGAVSCSR